MTVVNEAAIRQDIKQWSGLVLTGAWVALASVVLIVVQVAIYLLRKDVEGRVTLQHESGQLLISFVRP